jgi:DNA-binding NarL/FixJ family response regulator
LEKKARRDLRNHKSTAEVFRLIGQGHATRRIAEELHLSVKTVESYREHIKEKMLLGDASELVRYAIQWMEQEKSQ